MENIDLRQLLPQGALLQSGKYKVVRYLSSGNFGNTYIVENTGMGVQFAMKEFFLRNICYRTSQGNAVSISPAVDPDKVAVQREKFKKEARRLYGLTSKHLVHVNDMFEENGTVYYVMDFVKGESLASYMERKRQPLTEEQTLYILNQLLDGLDEVHAKQIWHLDLKPENLMIDSSGNVVIIDFGASKQVGQSGKYTGTSNILCYTPGYAPTEQVNQNMDAIGPWTDIYALGATLFNLLTGIDPSTVNPSALQFPRTVSARTQQLVRRMMSIDQNQRPQSIAEVRRLLASASSEKSSKLSDSKHKLAIFGLVAGGLVVALVLYLLFGLKVDVPGKQVVLADADTVEVVAQEVQKAEQEVIRFDSVNYVQTALGECFYVGYLDANDKPHGMGEATFRDNRYYKGPFVHGSFEGENAFFRYPNGDTFEGTFKNDAFYEGRYTLADSGDYFVGKFHDGQPADGTWYENNKNRPMP